MARRAASSSRCSPAVLSSPWAAAAPPASARSWASASSSAAASAAAAARLRAATCPSSRLASCRSLAASRCRAPSGGRPAGPAMLPRMPRFAARSASSRARVAAASALSWPRAAAWRSQLSASLATPASSSRACKSCIHALRLETLQPGSLSMPPTHLSSRLACLLSCRHIRLRGRQGGGDPSQLLLHRLQLSPGSIQLQLCPHTAHAACSAVAAPAALQAAAGVDAAVEGDAAQPMPGEQRLRHCAVKASTHSMRLLAGSQLQACRQAGRQAPSYASHLCRQQR